MYVYTRSVEIEGQVGVQFQIGEVRSGVKETDQQSWKGICCSWALWHSLTSQVISIAFYIEREKSDKFCSEALILAWGSFTCHKSMTQDQRLHFPSEGSHTQDFYVLKKIHQPWPGLNLQTSNPVASMITIRPLGSTFSNVKSITLSTLKLVN